MAKSLQEWNPLGKGARDFDNGSFDCVDIPKWWAEYLTDKPWQTSFCWGNAKDLYSNCPTTYWEKIPRGSQEPRVGDVVVMSGAIGGGYGHTGVVIEIIGNNIKIVQQNTFTQQAPYSGLYDKNASYIIGYLRPKVAFTVSNAPAPVALLGYQRKIGGDVMNYRQAPNTSAALMVSDSNPDGQWSPGEVLDFKGYVHGQAVDGDDIWLVGMHSGGYIHRSGFTDKDLHDLQDLTPAKLAGNQRQIGGDAMNWRKQARVEPNNVLRVLEAGKVLTLTGWIQGMVVDGNNVWFQYTENGTVGYVWSGGFADSGTHDLTQVIVDITPPVVTPPVVTPPVVIPPVVYPDDYTFKADLASVTEVKPAGLGSFEYGNFPAFPDTVVIHDMGTEGKDNLNSTIPWFQKKDNISAQFGVEGDRRVQFVKLGDRAYHAGPNGNNFIGIEVWPGAKHDPTTVRSVRLILTGLELFYGKQLKIIKHTDVKGAQTLCGDDINLVDYDLRIPYNPEGTADPVDDDRLAALELDHKKVVDFLQKTFKDFK